MSLNELVDNVGQVCQKADDIKYQKMSKLILSKIKELKAVNNMQSTDIATKEKFVEKAYYFAFHDQFVNPCFESGPEIRLLKEDGSPEIELKFSTDNKSAELKENKSSLLFRDVVLIETTAFFEFGDIIRFADTEDIPKHIRDLLYKIEKAHRKSSETKFDIGSNISEIFNPSDTISKIISGEMIYDSQKNDFFYTKFSDEPEDQYKQDEKDAECYKRFSQTYRAMNTASGIKSFGLLQMLSIYGFMKVGNLIIIDEPEAHLHPMWQIYYAELLVRLRKETGVTILLSTHSTYFIEALKVYSEKYSIEEQTCFYFAEKETMFSSNIKNVTDDLEIIYETLARPFEELDEIDAGLI